MKCIAVIGRKKTGKTTFSVGLLKSVNYPAYIYDINGEYNRHGIVNQYRGKLEKDSFLNAVLSVRNSFIVFEEAASYFSSRESDERIKSVLQRSRHQNNIVILIFHALADFPTAIYNRIDNICLFKTLDFQSTLDGKLRKNEQFLYHFNSVKSALSPHYHEIFEPL